MKELRSDMGTEYRNELVSELCKLMAIKQSMSTPHHHQTVGTIERNHRVFNEYIRSYISEHLENWDIYIHYFTFCYNISKHATFENRYSPYELVYGRSVNLPHELLSGRIDPLYNVEDFAKESRFILQTAHKMTAQLLDKMKLRNKTYNDKKAKPLDIKLGDKILLEIQPYNKHSAKYNGPFTVHNIDGTNVSFTNNNKVITVHKDRVRKLD